MKDEVELLEIGSQQHWDRWVTPSHFESGIQDNQPHSHGVPGLSGTVAEGRRG